MIYTVEAHFTRTYGARRVQCTLTLFTFGGIDRSVFLSVVRMSGGTHAEKRVVCLSCFRIKHAHESLSWRT